MAAEFRKQAVRLQNHQLLLRIQGSGFGRCNSVTLMKGPPDHAGWGWRTRS